MRPQKSEDQAMTKVLFTGGLVICMAARSVESMMEARIHQQGTSRSQNRLTPTAAGAMSSQEMIRDEREAGLDC